VGKYKYLEREMSWLAFNQRVLQEAQDHTVPLYERIRFMAIFSSNLDEFFRVRVASLRNLLELKRKTQKKLNFNPVVLLKNIHAYVHEQQEQLGKIYRKQIIPELQKYHIYLIQDTDLDQGQERFARSYFKQEVSPFIRPTLLFKNKVTLFLRNKSIYLAIKLRVKKGKSKNLSDLKVRTQYAIVEIPSEHLPRFIVLPSDNQNKYVIFLDDLLRSCMQDIFPGYIVTEMYSFKLTRDAELYIDDEFSGDLLDKIKKGISKRKTGIPSRFLFDLNMPAKFLKFLKDAFALCPEDLMPGGRYHNFNDFFIFPNLGPKHLEYKHLPALRNKITDTASSIFTEIGKKDHLLFFPYQTYDGVLRFLKEAASDDKVTAINITLYRVASDSKIIAHLIHAAKEGKSVTAFVEVKARFDEESNIRWAQELENAGVTILYSFPGLKVHSKLCLISRKNTQGSSDYCYLATGNFNEKTATIYTDIGFFTMDPKITKEVGKVFEYLYHRNKDQTFSHLLVAPFNMRKKFYELIDHEIQNAVRGKKAQIIIKLNSLQDKKIINKLYQASNAGVRISIIVRGICCLIPGIKGMSENIEAISIVDRFLEHFRVYCFYNGGKRKFYVSSADWMERNLNRRVEVAFPVYSNDLRRQLQKILEIQLHDNVKARIIDTAFQNEYRQRTSDHQFRSQIEIYEHLKKTVS
jgi:polyphosphate kinase